MTIRCFILFLVFFVFGGMYLSSCLKENNGASTTGSVVFIDTMGVMGVLNKCGGSQCHSAGGNASGEWLYDVNDFERSIKKNAGDIYEEAGTYGKGMASSKYANLSQAEVSILTAWYKAGAPNGTTTASKIAFTYAAVKTIFDGKCGGCHNSGGSAAARWTYDAADYNGSIKTNINMLYNTINSINAKMATAAYGNLSQSQVNSIVDWYNKGYPASN